jgi:hypothetical protein
MEKTCSIVKTSVAAKNVAFKLWDVQQLAEQNFAAVCRHVKAVEEEYVNRQHEMDRIIINTDNYDDNETLILLLNSQLTLLLGSLSNVF